MHNTGRCSLAIKILLTCATHMFIRAGSRELCAVGWRLQNVLGGQEGWLAPEGCWHTLRIQMRTCVWSASRGGRASAGCPFCGCSTGSISAERRRRQTRSPSSRSSCECRWCSSASRQSQLSRGLRTSRQLPIAWPVPATAHSEATRGVYDFARARTHAACPRFLGARLSDLHPCQ